MGPARDLVFTSHEKGQAVRSHSEPEEGSVHIIALVNQKGGCGKTTTAIHLSSCLASMGLRTLLVDLDPQGHSTLGLGVAPPERRRSLAQVLSASGLDENAVPLREILVPVVDGRFELAPGGAELAELETGLARVRGGEERLAEHLAPLIGVFDRVVLDAPPSLGMLTLNALTAAHEAIVPVEPSLYSLHGLARLSELTKLLAGHDQHQVRLRILVNAWEGRTRFAREMLEEIRRSFAEAVLRTVIRPSVRVREAAARGVPVDRYAPNSPIAMDYRALATELEEGRKEISATSPRISAPGLVAGRDGVYFTRRDVPPEQVRLAGDFNGWVPDSGVLLEMHEDGGWTKFVPLGPGRYEYKLVVGDRWLVDPLNPRRVMNSVGTTNSVLEIDA